MFLNIKNDSRKQKLVIAVEGRSKAMNIVELTTLQQQRKTKKMVWKIAYFIPKSF